MTKRLDSIIWRLMGARIISSNIYQWPGARGVRPHMGIHRRQMCHITAIHDIFLWLFYEQSICSGTHVQEFCSIFSFTFLFEFHQYRYHVCLVFLGFFLAWFRYHDTYVVLLAQNSDRSWMFIGVTNTMMKFPLFKYSIFYSISTVSYTYSLNATCVIAIHLNIHLNGLRCQMCNFC